MKPKIAATVQRPTWALGRHLLPGDVLTAEEVSKFSPQMHAQLFAPGGALAAGDVAPKLSGADRDRADQLRAARAEMDGLAADGAAFRERRKELETEITALKSKRRDLLLPALRGGDAETLTATNAAIAAAAQSVDDVLDGIDLVDKALTDAAERFEILWKNTRPAPPQPVESTPTTTEFVVVRPAKIAGKYRGVGEVLPPETVATFAGNSLAQLLADGYVETRRKPLNLDDLAAEARKMGGEMGRQIGRELVDQMKAAAHG